MRNVRLGLFVAICVSVLIMGSPGASNAADCTYSFQLPRGGEIWRHGTGQAITWSKIGTCSTRVELQLFRDGSLYSTISTGVDNSGNYRWTVPSSANPGRDYAIKIQDRDDYDSFVVSRQFTITNSSGCTAEITRPAQGDIFYKEEDLTIEWNTSGSCGSRASLDLYRTGGFVLQIAADVPNNGLWVGGIPGEFATGSDYFIKLTDLGDTTIYDFSGRFSVAPPRPCVFTIASPADEDTWYNGEDVTILWSSSGSCSSEVDLALMRGDDEVVTIVNAAANSGESSWTVPEDLLSGDDYTIRIRDTEDSESEGFSDAFSIIDDSGPISIYWLDNVARTNGAAGSVWRSDVVLLNPNEEDAEVELWFFAPDGAHVLGATVRNGTEGIFEDVVALIGTQGKGCLGIGATQTLLVSGRIYNETSNGTFGQFVQGWNDGDGLGEGQWGRLLQLRQAEGQFRTNLTVTNSGVSDGKVRIKLFDSGGNELHSYTINVAPRTLKQDLEPYKNRAGRPNLGWGFAVVEALEGEGLLVSASVIDSKTNDPTTIPIIVSAQ